MFAFTTADAHVPAVNIFPNSSSPPTHIFQHSALYTYYGEPGSFSMQDTLISAETREVHDLSSGYIRRDKNSDLVITVPEAVNGKYRIRFFDGEGNYLFEIRRIKDPVLVVEKYNFQHAGLFHYELYKENMLVEKNSFVIRRDQ